MWPFKKKEKKDKENWTQRYKEKLQSKKLATIIDMQEPAEQFPEQKDV